MLSLSVSTEQKEEFLGSFSYAGNDLAEPCPAAVDTATPCAEKEDVRSSKQNERWEGTAWHNPFLKFRRTVLVYTEVQESFPLLAADILMMMEYQVPQFIEVEDKIVGPLTLKQFIYVAGAGGLCVIFFVYLPTIIAFLLSAPIVGFAVALAFYKVNGKPFIEILEAGFSYYTGDKLFLWKRGDPKAAAPAVTPSAPPLAERGAARLTRGKLSELAWSLDVKQGGGKNQ